MAGTFRDSTNLIRAQILVHYQLNYIIGVLLSKGFDIRRGHLQYEKIEDQEFEGCLM